MPEAPVTTPQDEPVWRPPLRMYELPPSRLVRINQRERREAVLFWKRAGVIDESGQVAEPTEQSSASLATRRTARYVHDHGDQEHDPRLASPTAREG